MKNFKVYADVNSVVISINPKIFPLSVVYSAAYDYISTADVLIDGDPEEELLVEMQPIEKNSAELLNRLGNDFNNSLIDYALFWLNASNNQATRELILSYALHSDEVEFEVNKFKQMVSGPVAEDEEKENVSYLDDPEDIAKPWSEENS